VLRISLLRDAMRRLRRGLPKIDFLKSTHKDCANLIMEIVDFSILQMLTLMVRLARISKLRRLI
jgi:hypothetical protein